MFKNKIPQNEKEFFEFIINEEKYYLDIEFNHKTKINYFNLFMILKFYTNNDEFLLDYIYINSSEVDSHNYKTFNINLFHNININKIKKIKFFEFKDLIEELKENDYEYIKSLKYYGFRLIFNKQSILWTEFKYPNYPWNRKQIKLYYKREINIKRWLFNKNKILYKKLLIDIKRQSI